MILACKSFGKESAHCAFGKAGAPLALGRTRILCVSNDLASLQKVCDRVAALADGKIVAEGPMATMIASEHPWVKLYFRGERARGQPGLRMTGN
jgi:ABC-type transporter Mla maintaining outer membrane lipid asymmetry ATPase subunit MlaF